MFEKASKLKLRFQTVQGPLSLEQLWTITDENLSILADSLKEEVKVSKKTNYFTKSTKANKLSKLKLNIVLDIIATIVEERGEAGEALIIKAHNQKIVDKIAAKKDSDLDDLSVEELEKMLK